MTTDRTKLPEAQFKRITAQYPHPSQERERAQAFYMLGRNSDVIKTQNKATR